MQDPFQQGDKPIPPARPSQDECCHSGCDPCIFDLYEAALERYRVALQLWEQEKQKGKIGRNAAKHTRVRHTSLNAKRAK
jgi:hypothetical protein